MSLKTDKKLKEQAQKLANDFGFRLGTLINAFLRDFVRKKEVHFGMELPPEPMTPKLEKYLAKIEKDIKEGKNISPTFDNVEDAIAWLHQK